MASMASVKSLDFSTEGEEITEYRVLRRGDHLAVSGDKAGVEYYHHGIFLGHEKGVAEFGGENKQDAKTRIVDITQFTNNGQRRLIRIKYPSGHCLHPETAAKNAEDLVANPTMWGNYDLLTNNCEHFASKCKTGAAVSKQVISKIRDAIFNPVKLVAQAVLGSVGSSIGRIS